MRGRARHRRGQRGERYWAAQLRRLAAAAADQGEPASAPSDAAEDDAMTDTPADSLALDRDPVLDVAPRRPLARRGGPSRRRVVRLRFRRSRERPRSAPECRRLRQPAGRPASCRPRIGAAATSAPSGRPGCTGRPRVSGPPGWSAWVPGLGLPRRAARRHALRRAGGGRGRRAGPARRGSAPDVSSSSSTAATATATTGTSGPRSTPPCLRCPEPLPLVVEHCLPNALMRRWLDEMRAVRPGTAYHALDPTTLGRADARSPTSST